MSARPENAIAIIGMAGRFPKARNVDEYWRNICAGADCISRFSDSELEDTFDQATRSAANFAKARSVLEDADQFDAALFSMYPREAALTDPQHRVFLECCWSAFEDAGIDPAQRTVGVFAGASMPTYLIAHVLGSDGAAKSFASNYQAGDYATLMGSLPENLATRIAYKLDLRGPAMTVQSACSTSLLAVAQAVQSLLLNQCDLALAGGVSITFPQRRGALSQDGGMISNSGYCRPFDASADGTVFGSGAGVVLLKRLEDALADGDHIYCLIRGFGVNNDGAAKAGFTAPSVSGQSEAIAASLAIAGVEPDTIGYIECHGTGTPLGDPIEYAGLRRVFGGTADASRGCALGSVKANIGHLDAAAGVAGLIKTALLLKHGVIPPLANFGAPNPKLDAQGPPFYFPTELTPWPSQAGPRRAGISAFGVGGTNVHLTLEASPASARAPASDGLHILPLSARSAGALTELGAALAERLEHDPSLRLDDLAYTFQCGRQRYRFRRPLVIADRSDAIAQLRTAGASRRTPDEKVPSIVFMFPGQGSQYAGMGAELYAADRLFRADIDKGADLAKDLLGVDLRRIMFAKDGDEAVKQTLHAQPALFMIEVALARLLMRSGVQPNVMVGHSVGEFAAACVAGVFSFEEGLRLVAERARLMQSQPEGAMLAVRLPETELIALIGDALDLAAVNAPNLGVVSGPREAIDAFKQELKRDGVAWRELHTSHAFHSRSMDPVAAEFHHTAQTIAFSAAQTPIVSCVTGARLRDEEQGDARYWANQCRATVQFSRALSTAMDAGPSVLIEVGPGRVLTSLASQAERRDNLRAAVPVMAAARSEADEARTLASALGEIWAHGATLDWAALNPKARRAPAPLTPFEHQSYWADAQASPNAPASAQEPTPSIARETNHMIAPTTQQGGASPALRAQRAVVALMEELAGDDYAEIDTGASFIELGFDSLFLTQLAQALEAKLKLKIAFRDLLTDISSIDAVAAMLAPLLEDEPAAQVQSPISSTLGSSPGAFDRQQDFAPLFQAQLQAMASLIDRQLQTLNALGGPAETPAAQNRPQSKGSTAASEPDGEQPSRLSAYRPGSLSKAQRLSDAQRDFIGALAERTNERTPKAKQLTQANRRVLADPRTVSGFRQQWKELVYPIVCARSKGSKLWDADGNEYIDLVNGYGQTAFGHAPDFVTEAIAAELANGFAIGPQTALAGEVAGLVAELTGVDRVTFCNTGSEAVMAAIRVARTVTGRLRIVTFTNDYHGQFDEVLIKAGRASPKAAPAAPGVPAQSVENMIVLPYGDATSLDWIAQNASDIAAVLVEPVQSRHPELLPIEFLRRVREITAQSNTALIFDEVVTGFRTHPGGIQALWNIRADLVTYGKVLGGGMPVGVLAGARRFMDALDGGDWRYGDDSVPEVAPTFFAGTFVRHPLVLAAAKAVLTYIKDQGPALQHTLAMRTEGLVSRLNGELIKRGVADRAQCFSSWFYLAFPGDWLASLVFPSMRLRGVNMQEGFPCFLTTAHSDADIDAIVTAFAATLDELQGVGILTGGEVASANAPPAAVQTPPEEQSTPTSPADAPMTEPQMEIWLAAQLSDQASCAFNESLTLHLRGALDCTALIGAFNDIIARHDALRARFDFSKQRMLIADTLALEAIVEDVPADCEEASFLDQVVDEEARTAFDLANGPLVRLRLVRLAPLHHALVITAHHMVCDGWSFNVIVSELAPSYRARREGASAALPSPASFARYASTQTLSTAAEDYWLSRFTEIPDLPELPTDRTRPSVRTFGGDTVGRTISAAHLGDIKRAGARQGATLFTALLGGLQILLGRLANHTDIVVATPAAAQSQLGGAPLVGHCVHLLPMRQSFGWGDAVSAHLKALQHRVLEAYDHQAFTFGTLIRKRTVPRSPNRMPLVAAQFNLERLAEGLEFGELDCRIEPNAKRHANFDFFVNCIESRDGLRIDCDYNTDVFDKETIERWLGHYETLLRDFAANPDRAIGALALLTSEEQTWLARDLNATEAALPSDKGLHHLIEDVTARQGDHIACADSQGEWTYAELDARANQIAHRILTVAPNAERVAVAVRRSCDLIAALLGVMKAGRAYVPLDPDLPAARLAAILGQADVDACISDDAHFSAPAHAERIFLKDLERTHADPLAPDVGFDPERSAYVIFTSGTTGAPKGVEVPHRALVNFMASMLRRPGVGPDDLIVAVTTASFDIAALELFLPLVAGGRVTIASRDEVRDGFKLAALAQRTGATIVQATPSLWSMLLEAGLQPSPRLRAFCGGEVLPRDLAERLTGGGGELWNLYGPTETTIWSSCGRVEDERIVIGQPIANTELHVLDERDQLAPIGVVGELCIGGAGLAKGYFRRPDLTERAFREVALFGARRRLYRTGDLARRFPNGDIEVLGRTDRQVKVRGFRIELEEIEGALRQAPGVAACAVDVDRGESGATRLVAYVVAKPGQDPKPEAMAKLLIQQLPDYMVPALWRKLDALPHTPSGKLDRARLPSLDAPNGFARVTPTAPQTNLEKQIAEIWQEILGLSEIDTQSNFFALGGDSLHLFRIVARMLGRGFTISAQDILKHPTLQQLARHLADHAGDEPPPALPLLRDFRRGSRRRARDAT